MAAVHADFLTTESAEPTDSKSRWGELEVEGIPEPESSEDEAPDQPSLDETEGMEEAQDWRVSEEQGQAKLIDEFETAGYATPGFETPDIVQLRKDTKRYVHSNESRHDAPLLSNNFFIYIHVYVDSHVLIMVDISRRTHLRASGPCIRSCHKK